MQTPPPCVLVFSGADPSGGAGVQADIPTITACGAHPLTVITALTVQDNQTVFAVHPVAPELVEHQAQVLMDRFAICAIKLGIVGHRANADIIAQLIRHLRHQQPNLPVVFDPVLANNSGDALSTDDAISAIDPFFSLATVITPNRIEANRLCAPEHLPEEQAKQLMARGCESVLLKGGHAEGDIVINHLYEKTQQRTWSWPRLLGEFHGSGCTLAAAVSAFLARGVSVENACDAAQVYCQQTLASAYRLAVGQQIPNRVIPFLKTPP